MPRYQVGSIVIYDGSSGRILATVKQGPLQDGSYDLDCKQRVRPERIQNLNAGDMIEYYSASSNNWIPAKVVRPGQTPGTFDLDCKAAVDANRMRLPPSQPGTNQSVGALTAPYIPNRPSDGGYGPSVGIGGYAQASNRPSTGGNGPLGLGSGDDCFYQSSSQGWVLAQVVRYDPMDGTYDLDVKHRVAPEKIHVIREGEIMEYLSQSSNQWIAARIIRKGQATGTYDLDCKAGVDASRLRPVDTPGTDYSMAPPTAAGRSDPETERKREQLRRAVASQDASRIRDRMESQSALNLVGEELDHAAHMLWSLEARPAAQAELSKAASGSSVENLQAALEAAAAVGVPDSELEIAARQLHALKAEMWRYDAGDGKHIDLRSEPKIDGKRVKNRLNAGDVFRVSQELRGDDGAGKTVTYLKLADGRGWAFDKKPGVGVLCVRQYPAVDQSSQQISLTVRDLRKQHKDSMKAAPRMASIRETMEPDGTLKNMW